MSHRHPRPTRGVSLIEALVTLVVLAFGMLALTGMQIALSRDADLSRQRSEAVRLAQAKLEELRSFATLSSSGALIAWNEMPDSQVEPHLNASNDRALGVNGSTVFTRTTRLNGRIDDSQRSLQVSVSWTDRAGETQEIVLASIVSRSDPADGGALLLPVDQSGLLRRPVGRDIDIPIAATPLRGRNTGQSALRWSGASGGWLIFENRSGKVAAICAAQPTDETDIASSCTALSAYLLTGFIDGDIAIYAPHDVAFSNTRYIVASPACHVSDAFDPRSHAPIPGYKAYACLVQPSDHDGKIETPPVWSARTDIVPAPADGQKVCRYSRSEASTSNALHPAVYDKVDRTLDRQNFRLIATGACPSGTVQHAP